MSFEDESPKTVPPPGDPDKAWRVAFMAEMTATRLEMKELLGDVRKLTKVARECFEQMLKNEAIVNDLRTRLEIVEARITLAPPRVDG
jgi:hypothetical protein